MTNLGEPISDKVTRVTFGFWKLLDDFYFDVFGTYLVDMDSGLIPIREGLEE